MLKDETTQFEESTADSVRYPEEVFLSTKDKEDVLRHLDSAQREILMAIYITSAIVLVLLLVIIYKM
jgi:hypothetical protein